MGFGGFWGVLGGADNVLGCRPYKIFSWTCCYAIHSSLAPYPAARYQLLLVTCKTLLIFALLFLGGVGGANSVLGCPPYKIFSWTCCYAMHFSCNVPCHTLSTSSCNLQDTLDFCIVVSWGVGGANNVLGCPPYKIFSWTCCYAMHFSCNVPCHTLSTSSCNLQDTLDFCIVVSWGGLGPGLITFLAACLTR